MLSFLNSSDPLRLAVTRSDYVTLTPRWQDKDASLGSTRLYFVESGNGWLEVAGEKLPLEPGYVYLIPSYFHFGYGCSGLKKLYFHIRLLSAEQTDLLCDIGQVLKLPYEPETLQQLLDCYKPTDVYSLLRLQMLLLQTVCRFVDAYRLPTPPIKTYSETLRQAIAYLQAAPSL